MTSGREPLLFPSAAAAANIHNMGWIRSPQHLLPPQASIISTTILLENWETEVLKMFNFSNRFNYHIFLKICDFSHCCGIAVLISVVTVFMGMELNLSLS